MENKEKTIIGGIMLVLITISSGVTFYLSDSGTKTSCRRGWEYTDGYYSCTTNSGIRYETCFEVYDSANTKNYWCKKGARVEIESLVNSNLPTKGDYICPKRPNSCQKV